jgi:formaldehyde-activating enzyme
MTLDGRLSQAWGGVNPNGVHLNVLLAERGSPTAAAVTTAFTNPTDGFTPILVCVGEDQPSYETVHPPTVMLNKTASPTEEHELLVAGACQVGIAQGVLDAVADDLLAADQDTLVFVAVWLAPDADTGSRVRAAAREATFKGVREAVRGHDAAARLVAERDSLTHPFFTP